MILTKEYRMVWNSELILYGQFNLDTQTETLENAFECDTQEELDDKVISLGFQIPVPCIYGCTNPNAINYNPLATCDDSSCVVIPPH
tara:strand:- start:6155 stop:6415 length:261 start_codon:yes stop_codon:yes gene_type:complete